jgi:AcrR family transcriptional regulator/protein-L-isoaspartate O-methyltransferase
MARGIASTRDRLLEAATRLFAEQGFEGTSVGQIEAAAGLVPRRGSLYKHFASKEDLLRAAVDARAARASAFLDLAEHAFASPPPSPSQLHDLVRGFGAGFLAELDAHRDLTRIIEHDGERFPELRDRIRREVIAPGYRAVSRTLQRLAPPGTDSSAHAALLLAALTGLRRSAWTFGRSTYRISDARALDAWAAQCVALVVPQPGTDPHALGYRRVDADARTPVLLDAMDATGSWPATAELRAWERVRLHLRRGERLLDVGCGLGDAGRVLASDVGPDGAVLGIDASAAMVEAARARASDLAWVRHEVGDACDLGVPDGSFDAARAERVLQWLDDPDRAVAELVRAVRPGGRLSLIDTDWSTFTLAIGDGDLERRLRRAMRTERNRPSNIGRRLAAVVRSAGCEVVAEHVTTHRCSTWDPDGAPAPPGFPSMASLAEDLVGAGELPPERAADFVDQVHAAARAGRFELSLTMHAVVATTPAA